jgi:ABC-2 type transport system ATP-binding protein
MINFVHITKKFQANFWEKPFTAVDDVSFSIQQGDLVGFLGANGAGKTTLIKILMDFSRQDSGKIIFSRSLGKTLLDVKSSIGYLPERAYLYPHLTGREFLNYVGSLAGVESQRLHDLTEELAKKLSIDQALDRLIKNYSKGMQQRLGFVSVLLHEPKILILDEPLSGLDPLGRREFKTIMKDLNQKGITVFFSSHVVADVEEICNKVIFIEKGKLVHEGSVDKLIVEHSNDFYDLKYITAGKIEIVKVHEDEKNQKILDILNNGAQILEIEKEKPSLEEIIYKIKK